MGSWVELNVGGRIFGTFRSTLLNYPSPYFSRLLAEDSDGDVSMVSGGVRDSAGRLCIDRDPALFEKILEYCRGSLEVDMLGENEKSKLRKEAEFYQLDSLIEALGPIACEGYDEKQLSREDWLIRKQAQEVRDALDRGETRINAGVDHNGGTLVDDLLIDLFPQQAPRYSCRYQDKMPSSPNCTFLFQKAVESARSNTRGYLNPPESIEKFKERFIRFGGGPLMQDFPMDNLVFAGGAVLQCLLGDVDALGSDIQAKNADLDLFVVADTEEEAMATFQKIIEHFKQYALRPMANVDMLVVRSAFAVTFITKYPQRHIQLILRRHQCIGDVIFNFDVDCCQVAFDGRQVWASPSAHRALLTGINIADPERSSSDYEARLSKYANRGFLVGVPGLEMSRVRKMLTNYCFVIEDGDMKKVNLFFAKSQVAGLEFTSFKIDPEIIEGLAKLIVLSCLGKYSPIGNLQEEDYWFNRPHVNERAMLGNYSVETTATFLLNIEKLQNCTSQWKLRTPPHPPPAAIQTTIESYKKIGSTGEQLFPFEPDLDVVIIFRRLKSLLTDWFAQSMPKLVCCYDYLENVSRSTDCPHVLDAASQFPSYPFVSNRGKLERFLTFPPSTATGSNPWIRNLPSEWTKHVYESKASK